MHHDGFRTFDEFLDYAEGASNGPASVFVHLCCLDKIQDEYFPKDLVISDVARPCAIFSYLVHIIRDFQKDQFNNLNKILFMMSIIWFYFWFNDALGTWYAKEPAEFEVLRQTILGPYLPIFAAMILFNFVLPFGTLGFRQVRTSWISFVVAVLINVGMYAERILIVIPPQAHGRFPFVWRDYFPTWVELSIMAAAAAGFALLYLLFAKFFPVVAIWEIKEGQLLKSSREVATSR